MPRATVLLVEDSPSDALLTLEMLEGRFRVEHVTSLAAARARLSRPEPNLGVVLLDLTLPDGSGEETYEKLSGSCPVPIVVMSGDADPRLAHSLEQRGAAGFLVKGETSLERLVGLVEALCAATRSEA